MCYIHTHTHTQTLTNAHTYTHTIVGKTEGEKERKKDHGKQSKTFIGPNALDGSYDIYAIADVGKT